MRSQGGQANYNGKNFEQMLFDRLIQQGYEHIMAIPIDTGVVMMVNNGVFVPWVREHPYFLSQWKSPFRNLFKQPMTLDFYVWHPVKHPRGLLVELKYQELSGSVDEKYPYHISSLLGTGVPAMFIVTGTGARAAAREWCKAQEQPGRLTVITSADEFMRRLNRDLF